MKLTTLPTLTALAFLSLTTSAAACGEDHPAAIPPIKNADDIKNNGDTLLHVVCKSGAQPGVIRMLVEYGADVNRRQEYGDGNTPLMLLAGWSKGDITDSVRTLLSLGADPTLLNTQGKSALHFVWGRNLPEVEKLLTENLRSRLNQALASDNREDIARIITAGADINEADIFNATALSKTYFSNKVEQAEFLLSLGANPNLTPMVGGRIDLLPFSQCQKHDSTAMIELLHRHGLDINKQGNMGDRYLISAANGNILHTKWALAHGANPTLTDSQGRTALMAATTLEIAELLLHAAPQMLHHRDEDGNTAMHHAAMKGAVSEQHAAHLWTIAHKTGDGKTANSYKTGSGAQPVAVCRMLSKAGLPVNDTNQVGQTALMLAARTGDLALCQCLIELGADVAPVDKTGRSALSYAQQAANKELVQYLRGCGAPGGSEEELLQAVAAGDMDKATALLDNGLNVKDNVGFTAMEQAINAGQEEIARLLIERGVDIHSMNAAGKTLLHAAIEANNRPAAELLLRLGAQPTRKARVVNATVAADALTAAAAAGHIDMVQLLLNNGMKVEHTPFTPNPALTFAIRLGHTDIVNLLLEHGAPLNIRGESVRDDTPLCTAVQSGNSDMVRHLLARGAVADAQRGAALTAAIRLRKPNVEIVRMLLAAGAQAERVDNYNRNTLSEAACFNPPEVISMLINAGADVNRISTDGLHCSTALINACRLQKQDPVEVVRLLLEAGAAPNVKDARGKTACDYAIERGHTQAAELLQKASR